MGQTLKWSVTQTVHVNNVLMFHNQEIQFRLLKPKGKEKHGDDDFLITSHTIQFRPSYC